MAQASQFSFNPYVNYNAGIGSGQAIGSGLGSLGAGIAQAAQIKRQREMAEKEAMMKAEQEAAQRAAILPFIAKTLGPDAAYAVANSADMGQIGALIGMSKDQAATDASRASVKHNKKTLSLQKKKARQEQRNARTEARLKKRDLKRQMDADRVESGLAEKKYQLDVSKAIAANNRAYDQMRVERDKFLKELQASKTEREKTEERLKKDFNQKQLQMLEKTMDLEEYMKDTRNKDGSFKVGPFGGNSINPTVEEIIAEAGNPVRITSQKQMDALPDGVPYIDAR